MADNCFHYNNSDDHPSSSTPKLSLFSSFPSNKLLESPAGLSTPPVHALASVPFQWEEAPGKPRRWFLESTSHSKPKSAARCLELPPRLLHEAKVSNMPSPTTVLQGPYDNLAGRSAGDKEKSLLGSQRWASFRKNSINGKKQVVTATFDDGAGTKVNITRSIKRRSSFLSFSPTKSHIWTSIYENVKQVVPWRRHHKNQPK